MRFALLLCAASAFAQPPAIVHVLADDLQVLVVTPPGLDFKPVEEVWG